MNCPIDAYRLCFTQGEPRHRVFEPPDAATEAWIKGLYEKYRQELIDLTEQMQGTYRTMTQAGYGAAFGDVEGEMLYLLVREFRPRLIYEISPNAGYSTNYLLAAITRNGAGRIEGFELEPQLLGRPTDQVIRSHFIASCDGSRYHL